MKTLGDFYFRFLFKNSKFESFKDVMNESCETLGEFYFRFYLKAVNLNPSKIRSFDPGC